MRGRRRSRMRGCRRWGGHKPPWIAASATWACPVASSNGSREGLLGCLEHILTSSSNTNSLWIYWTSCDDSLRATYNSMYMEKWQNALDHSCGLETKFTLMIYDTSCINLPPILNTKSLIENILTLQLYNAMGWRPEGNATI
jgi:hypothetical protein